MEIIADTNRKDLVLEPESQVLDYKKAVSGLDRDDLVDFANSHTGGRILIGIEEAKLKNGQQVGVVVGCPVDDIAKRQIQSMADQCHPKVKIEITVQVQDSKRFFEINVPSGSHKPYCTSGGTYKVRIDGRNETLAPNKLLDIFVKVESEKFINSFELATQKLMGRIDGLFKDVNLHIRKKMDEMDETLDIIQSKIVDHLEEISNSSSNVENETDSLRSAVEDIQVNVEVLVNDIEHRRVYSNVARITECVNAIVKNLSIEDPTITRMRRLVLAATRYDVNNYGAKQMRQFKFLEALKSDLVDVKTIQSWIKEAIASPKVALNLDTDEEKIVAFMNSPNRKPSRKTRRT